VRDQESVAIHQDVAAAVDASLRDLPVVVEVRRRQPDGAVLRDHEVQGDPLAATRGGRPPRPARGERPSLAEGPDGPPPGRRGGGRRWRRGRGAGSHFREGDPDGRGDSGSAGGAPRWAFH
jgi:hypothetical protein